MLRAALNAFRIKQSRLVSATTTWLPNRATLIHRSNARVEKQGVHSLNSSREATESKPPLALFLCWTTAAALYTTKSYFMRSNSLALFIRASGSS